MGLNIPPGQNPNNPVGGPPGPGDQGNLAAEYSRIANDLAAQGYPINQEGWGAGGATGNQTSFAPGTGTAQMLDVLNRFRDGTLNPPGNTGTTGGGGGTTSTGGINYPALWQDADGNWRDGNGNLVPVGPNGWPIQTDPDPGGGTPSPSSGGMTYYDTPQNTTGGHEASYGDIWSATNPFGPDLEDLAAVMAQGFPGVDMGELSINTEEGARAIELMYGVSQQALQDAMRNKATQTMISAQDQYKSDPVLERTQDMVYSILQDPYTLDAQTLQLMRNQSSDLSAEQQASTMERLRAMGGMQGISPDSGLMASLANQAMVARDLAQQRSDRELSISAALQSRDDEKEAVALGSQFGGAYQSMLGQLASGQANIQSGAGVAQLDNPFAGLWQGMVAQRQMNEQNRLMRDAMEEDEPAWWEKALGAVTSAASAFLPFL